MSFQIKTKTVRGGKLAISVTVNDFATDGTTTRAYEDGNYTYFTDGGDTLGLYVVRDGEIVYENVPFVMPTTDEAEKRYWEQADNAETIRTNPKKDSYFFYYPYKKGIDKSLVNPAATDDDADFFAGLISSWEVKNDQSDYATGYTASDLMTAKSDSYYFKEENTIVADAHFNHRMSLVTVSLSGYTYELHYNGTELLPSPVYTVYPSDVRFAKGYHKFWNISKGKYRFIINPAKMVTTTYTVDWGWSTSTKRYTYDIDLSNIKRGYYRHFDFNDDMNHVLHTFSLQVGDLFMNDGLLVSKDEDLSGADGGVIKSNILGVVFSVGHNENDMTDYSKTGIGTEKCHAYVVTRRMVNPGTSLATWSKDITSAIGCWPRLNNKIDGPYNETYINEVEDWSGYTWTQMIIKANGGTDNLSANYGAVYYATQMRSNGGNFYSDYVKAPASSSGYFLAAKDQLLEVLNFENNTGIGESTRTDIGYTRLIDKEQWSSTECQPWLYSNLAVVVKIDNGLPTDISKAKNGKAEARPFLAF